MTTSAFVKYCLAVCLQGFANEHAWVAWLRARQDKIDKLPPPLRRRVLDAHANSGPKASP